MSVVFWTGAVDGSFSTNGNWSATPADGDIAVINTGATDIPGGDFLTYAEFSSVIVGPGYTGNIGSSTTRAEITTNTLQLSNPGNVYVRLELAADPSTEYRLLMNGWGKIVDIDDARANGTRQIHISEAAAGNSTATINAGASSVATMTMAGMRSETINMTGSIATLRIDSGVLKGGDVTGKAVVSGGEWWCGDAADLQLFGGSVFPGAVDSSTITDAHIYGGTLSLEKAIGQAVTLPNGSTGHLNTYNKGVVDLQTGGVRPAFVSVSRGSGLIYPASGESLTAGVA